MKLEGVRTSDDNHRTIVVGPSVEGGRFLFQDQYEIDFVAQTIELHGATEEEAELCKRALVAHAGSDEQHEAQSFLDTLLASDATNPSRLTGTVEVTDDRWLSVVSVNPNKSGAMAQQTLYPEQVVHEFMPYVPQAVGAVALK